MAARHPTPLPLADYDQLAVGTLEHRIRSLSEPDLERLLSYEHEHADRPAVVRLLTTRIGQLEAGATPSPGGAAHTVDEPRPGHGGSRVSPVTSPQPIHPPPHGTPDQPGQPKANRP